MEVLDVSVKRDSGTAMDGNRSSAPGHPLPNFTDVFQVQDAILSRSLLTLVMSLTSNELAGDAGYSLEVSPCVDGAEIRYLSTNGGLPAGDPSSSYPHAHRLAQVQRDDAVWADLPAQSSLPLGTPLVVQFQLSSDELLSSLQGKHVQNTCCE